VTALNVCFHGIGTPGRELEPGEAPYWVTADRFREILDELATWPAVRISFDDGNASDVEYGLPGLAERGLRADFFVLAGRLGAAGSLDADQVRTLAAHGMTIGSHGMAHRSWRDMDPTTRDAELVAAREQLAEAADTPVETAACPLGRYDRRLLTDLRRLGYRHVFTSDRRPARAGAWLQPRYSVRHTDTASSLRAEVRPNLVARTRLEAVGLAKRLR
jgi:peptidoglycan/xylan/chitin deacetylase (PgdA/CDA1 family)